ncbi:MAG: DNA cytosine methyltransferase [Caulobacteraceae bacterium]
MARQGRAPRTLVVENVTGLLTSHGGADFTALCTSLAAAGYRFGALEVDAALLLPQSRPRLFVVATREPPPEAAAGPEAPFHSPAVVKARAPPFAAGAGGTPGSGGACPRPPPATRPWPTCSTPTRAPHGSRRSAQRGSWP